MGDVSFLVLAELISLPLSPDTLVVAVAAAVVNSAP